MVTRRIKLIVTGDMEKAAIHLSLRDNFPAKNFANEEVFWDTPRKEHCATSNRLRPNAPASNPMRALAKAMLAEVLVGKHGIPADLVLVIDDVELNNLGQEALIAASFRDAVQIELTQRCSTVSAQVEDDFRTRVRERCSFHLLRPMVEAYLFSDVIALGIAGVPAMRTPLLRHATNVEDFESIDPNWLPQCQLKNAAKQLTFPWWRHEHHPKHYLEHLVGEASATYEETQQGANALRALNWCSVAKIPTDGPIISSLFEDVFEWFGLPNSFIGNSCPDFYPTRYIRRNQLLLRNM